MGSLLCEQLSGQVIEIGLVPSGAFGLSAFAVDLYFAAAPVASAELIGGGEFLARRGSFFSPDDGSAMSHPKRLSTRF